MDGKDWSSANLCQEYRGGGANAAKAGGATVGRDNEGAVGDQSEKKYAKKIISRYKI